jgi:hypothetical protein
MIIDSHGHYTTAPPGAADFPDVADLQYGGR